MTAQARAVLDAVDMLGRASVLSPTGHISVSARTESGMLMATRGLAHELLADTFVEIDLAREPSGLDAEIALCDLHWGLYGDRDDVGAVLHTHSPFATAFALAHVSLPVHYEALWRYGQTVPVPVAPWSPRGSFEFSRSVRTTLQRHPDSRSVLLANHGLLVVGPTPHAAAKLVIGLEEAAAAEIRAASLGGAKPMSNVDFL